MGILLIFHRFSWPMSFLAWLVNRIREIAKIFSILSGKWGAMIGRNIWVPRHNSGRWKSYLTCMLIVCISFPFNFTFLHLCKWGIISILRECPIYLMKWTQCFILTFKCYQKYNDEEKDHSPIKCHSLNLSKGVTMRLPMFLLALILCL